MPPTLREIARDLLQKYGLHPKKRLGQHFLVDPQALERIVEAAELSPDDTALEIGTGLGFLTDKLAQKCGRVISVEIDNQLIKAAEEFLKGHRNITLIAGDFLKLDLNKLLDPETKRLGSNNLKVVGNLPYYITAPIIEKIFELKPRRSAAGLGIRLAVLTVQKEVAERMSAKPGTKIYGSFTVFVQYHAQVEISSLIDRRAFYPRPEVDSAAVVLRPHQTNKYKVNNEKLFFDVVHAAFQQRRKKIRNSLSGYDLRGVSVDLNRRPETLSIEEFAQLVADL